jgi:flagellar basal-body rod protein FlgB
MFDLVSNNSMIQMMDRSMTLATRRMTLIAANLANIDTPNYHTQDFSFEKAFKQSMAELDRQLSPSSMPSYFTSASSATVPTTNDDAPPAYERNDLNDVNLDQQTELLAKTQNIYQLSSGFAQNELRTVLGAIRDAGK